MLPRSDPLNITVLSCLCHLKKIVQCFNIVSMFTVKQIAKYFLALSDPKVGDIISNLKLQKLCYYGQGFHLAFYGTRLFPNKIEAWTHGPVIRELYQAYKKHGDIQGKLLTILLINRMVISNQ